MEYLLTIAVAIGTLTLMLALILMIVSVRRRTNAVERVDKRVGDAHGRLMESRVALARSQNSLMSELESLRRGRDTSKGDTHAP